MLTISEKIVVDPQEFVKETLRLPLSLQRLVCVPGLALEDIQDAEQWQPPRHFICTVKVLLNVGDVLQEEEDERLVVAFEQDEEALIKCRQAFSVSHCHQPIDDVIIFIGRT